MPRVIQFIAILVLGTVLAQPAAHAQQIPGPDYGIRNIRSRLSDDNAIITVEFEVQNTGAAATIPSTVDLAVIQTGEIVVQETVNPLQSTEIVTVRLPIQVSQLPSGTVQSLRAAVGIDEVEASGSATVRNNFAQISIEVPGVLDTSQPDTQPDALAPTPTAAPGFPQNFIDALPIDIDTTDSTQRAVLAGVVGGLVLLLLLTIIILRLIFRRIPTFGVWQPPYAEMPYIDPSSVWGRRHLWQRSARNNALPAICAERTPHIRKLLRGIDGEHLTGWRVAAIRLSSYDHYGRIAPSQVIAASRLVRRLNKVAHKYQSDPYEKLIKRVNPVAKGLIKTFTKKINKRSAMLPIALDIRFEGQHGEVRIVFELYQCLDAAWQQIDHWEPEMTVLGKMIHEMYEYSLYGQRPGESSKDFRKRLQDDLAGLLAYMISAHTSGSMTQITPTHPAPPISAEEIDAASAPPSTEPNLATFAPPTTETNRAPDTSPAITETEYSSDAESTSQTDPFTDDD